MARARGTPRFSSIMHPQRVAVLGASSKRFTLGNQVLQNFAREGFGGSVVALSEHAEQIERFPTAPSIEDLPRDLDVAMVCIPAASLPDVLHRLDAIGCQSAVVPTAGFTSEQLRAFEGACDAVEMTVTGPNCLGILSVPDAAPLWTPHFRPDLPRGGTSLVAQSGSAAISIMSGRGVGFARIISSGSELSVTSAHYIDWLAADPETTCIGLVIESIRSPEHFARAVARAQEAGKALVALKVGRSVAGSLATEAHTGALVSSYDAYEAFFARIGVPTALDYDELGATLQCFGNPTLPRALGGRVGIVGISGGQTALACDLAAEAGVQLAAFSPDTVARIEEALPGAPGWNPIDIGASVGPERRHEAEAIRAVVDDPGVDSVLIIQDAHATLPLHPAHRYMTFVRAVVEVARESDKPIVMASSSAGDVHPLMDDAVAGSPVPLVRGLHPALVALRNMGTGRASFDPQSARTSRDHELEAAVASCAGPLPRHLVQLLLEHYGIPFVASGLAKDREDAVALGEGMGFPLVVKIASPDVPHRLEVGGVVTDVQSVPALEEALERIEHNVRSAVPGARIECFEIQRQVSDAIEAIVGFMPSPPFGPTIVVGSGGSFVELVADRSSDLAPVTFERAKDMIERTAMGKLLGGYRNKVAPTSTDGLAMVLHAFSRLAADWCDLVGAGDLNPVLVESGSGTAVVVDALLIARH